MLLGACQAFYIGETIKLFRPYTVSICTMYCCIPPWLAWCMQRACAPVHYTSHHNAPTVPTVPRHATPAHHPTVPHRAPHRPWSRIAAVPRYLVFPCYFRAFVTWCDPHPLCFCECYNIIDLRFKTNRVQKSSNMFNLKRFKTNHTQTPTKSRAIHQLNIAI